MIVIDMDIRVLILYKYNNCDRCKKCVRNCSPVVRFNTNNYGGTGLKGDLLRTSLRYEPVYPI